MQNDLLQKAILEDGRRELDSIMKYYSLFIEGLENTVKAKPEITVPELIETCKLGQKMLPKFLKIMEDIQREIQ